MKKLLLFFLVGVFLGGVAAVASAETISATSQTVPPVVTYYIDYNGRTYGTSGPDACAKFGGSPYNAMSAQPYSYPTTNTVNVGTCVKAPYEHFVKAATGCQSPAVISGTSCVVQYACPSGQNWTLTGTSCTRPDCPSGATRQSDGTCSAPCTAGETKEISYFSGKWAVCAKEQASCLTGTLNLLTSYCDGRCLYSLPDAILEAPANASATVDNPQPVYIRKTGTATGASCSSATPTDAGSPPAIPQKKPPCAAGEGVLTSSSGAVKCVPSSTPGNEPKVSKSTKTESFGDGSTRTTETTRTTDPASGSTSENTKTTNTPNSSGGQGQAGPVGSNEGTTDTSRKESGKDKESEDDADCDPREKMCGNPGTEGLYEKKGKTVAESFGDFTSKVKGSPIGSASTGFFNVSTPGGGCPGWSVNVPFLNVTLDGAAFFCNSTIINAMQGAGAVLLALASYIAFTWAFL